MRIYVVNNNQTIPADTFDKIKAEMLKYKIKGEIAQYSSDDELKTIIERASKAKSATIIAIGDDYDFEKLIDQAAKLNNDFVLGFVPTKNTELATILGISNWKKAIEALSQRKVKEFVAQNINNKFFIGSIELHTSKAGGQISVEIDKKLNVTLPGCILTIKNIHEASYGDFKCLKITAHEKSEENEQKQDMLAGLIKHIKKSYLATTPQLLLRAKASKIKIMIDSDKFIDSNQRSYKNVINVGTKSKLIKIITAKKSLENSLN